MESLAQVLGRSLSLSAKDRTLRKHFFLRADVRAPRDQALAAPPSVFATLVHVSSEKCLTPERLPGFWRSRKQALHTLQCLLVCNGTKRQR